MTRSPSFDGFVDRLSGFSFRPPDYPSYRVLTFALVGLSPTEYASLRWTRQHAGLSRRTPDCRQTSRGCHQTLGYYLAQSLKSVFVLEPGPLLLHPRGPVSHDGDRLRSVQAWRQREDSLTVAGNVVPVVVPVQQRSEQRMHLSGLKLSAVEDIREVSFFSGVLWSTSPHTSC